MSELKGPFRAEVTHHNETANGTKYEVCKWRCPQCQHARSTLYIDGEWCHGDSFCVSWREGVEVQQCGTCWSAAPLGAVAVDAAPEQKPVSVHSIESSSGTAAAPGLGTP